MVKEFKEFAVKGNVIDMAVGIVRQTRPESSNIQDIKDTVSFGAGPRGAQWLVLAAKARALLQGRSVVDEDDIHQGQQRVRLDESLVRVPGVFIQNRDNFAQGARVSIRGFGARAQGGHPVCRSRR